MSRIKIIDATLRDGSHAVKHKLTKQQIRDYCIAIDDVGMDTVVVGHGNGLGASSLQVGLSDLSDNAMLEVARSNLKNTKLGVYMIPGFGTIRDNLKPAIDIGIDVVKIGCHCTEADTTKQHIEYAKNAGKTVYGILMMYHTASTKKIVEEAKKMEDYGANGIIIMDSAGASTMSMVKNTFSELMENIDVRLGFHAHNNLGIAVANTMIAINEGATIVDATTRGFGAGAGNCQIEAIIALLQKENISTSVDLFKLMDCSEKIVKNFSSIDKGLDDISIVNGVAGIFSGFKIHVQNAAREFEVDPREILLELGRRKVIGGQEDVIVEVAKRISDRKRDIDESYYLSALL